MVVDLTAANAEIARNTDVIGDVKTLLANLTQKIVTPSRLNVRDFWTSADGNDYYPAFSKAISVARDSSKVGSSNSVYFSGRMPISKPLNISNSVHVFGDGIGTSILVPDAANNGIMIDTLNPVKLNDFSVEYSSPAATGTSAISVTCSDTSGSGLYGNSSSVFRDLLVLNASTSLSLIAAEAFVVDNLKSLLHSTTGIDVSNVHFPDAGDGIIQNCYLLGANMNSLAGIRWMSSGALSICNNKILTHRYGVLCQLADGAQTRQMFILGNSIDGTDIAAVAFWPLGRCSFGGVIVANNIFNLALNGISAPTPPIGKWINTMNVNCNNWYPNAPGGVYLDSSAVTSVVNTNMTER